MMQEHSAAPDAPPLAWENLGAEHAGRALHATLCELLCRPTRFFDRMATSGGLHEPLTFFLIALGATIVVGFLAALTCFALLDPDPTQPAAYALLALPPRATGLMLVLLPEALVAAAVAVVMLGTLLHLGAAPFGARGWEGSVSVCAYSAAAALVPVLAAMAVVFAVALPCYALSAFGLVSEQGALAVAKWTWRVLCILGLACTVVALPVNCAIGLARAMRLEPATATAAALTGLALAAAQPTVCIWAFVRRGAGAGLWACLACMAACAGAAAWHVVRPRRLGGGP